MTDHTNAARRATLDRFTMRPGRPDEAADLSALAMRSKAHWGYDAEFMAACREDLTVDPTWCDGSRLTVAERAGRLIGYSRISGCTPVGDLDALLVDPAVMGAGVGTALLQRAVACARSLDMARLSIDSDPHAESFYLRAGAVRVGQSESTVIPGRQLPRLEIELSDWRPTART